MATPLPSPPAYNAVRMSPTAGATCYNSSHCAFPMQCILETGYRRYCGSSSFAPVAGRTLFDLSGVRDPSIQGCKRCFAPLVLADFGSLADTGAYQCSSVCELTSGDTVAESYVTSICAPECTFAPMELLGAASLGTSPHFPGAEPADGLHDLRQLAATARTAAAVAEVEAERAAAVARAADEARNATGNVEAELRAEIDRANDAIDLARYVLSRAHDAAGQASATEARTAAGRVIEAESRLQAALDAHDAALADLAAHHAARPFLPTTEVTAPAAEAAVRGIDRTLMSCDEPSSEL